MIISLMSVVKDKNSLLELLIGDPEANVPADQSVGNVIKLFLLDQ